MATSFNSVTLVGRLVKEPEMVQASNGTQLTRNTLAVERALSKKNETDFIDIVIFGSQAKFVCDYLRKGNLVLITGELNVNSYEKDGVKKSSTVVSCNRVINLTSKDENKPKVKELTQDEMEGLPF